MNNKYGPDLLFEQLVEHLAGDWEWRLDESPGDSKIEKLLFHALNMRSEMGATEYSEIVVARALDDENRLKEESPSHPSHTTLIVRPQAEIPWADGRTRRVDFLISALDWRVGVAPATWRSLAVECDGHDFHAKTKEQVARDRSKDRAATLSGIEFFRFTGSEIWRDPWGYAGQITDWAATGFG